MHQSIIGVLPFPVISGAFKSLRVIVKMRTSAYVLGSYVCMYLNICICVFVFLGFFICLLEFDHLHAGFCIFFGLSDTLNSLRLIVKMYF